MNILTSRRYFFTLQWLVWVWLLMSAAGSASAYPAFQALVDAADPKGVLVPPPGIYSGPVVIKSPITIDGQDKVTIDGGGKGSVIVIQTNGATVKNLHLTNSGSSHNDLDAGVQVRGNNNVVKYNKLDNVLFGIALEQSKNNIIRGNRISSKPYELGLRGDAIRLWYSFNNKITDNVIRNSRDTVIWYSRDNLIARNDARGGRYSLHFMYAQYNEVRGNHFEDNSVGIFLMYSDGIHIRDNYIMRATGATGLGIGFKETSGVIISGNRVLNCAVGLYLDLSPFQPDSVNRIENNLIAYNGVGVTFLNDWKGNIFKANRFKSNLTQVVVSGGGKTANRNLWDGNYWDDYEGFDRNDDGVGDTPYELYSYADRIWMDVPPAQFLKGAPVMEMMDFLERLAPFNEPNMLVRDKQPLMKAEWSGKPPVRAAAILMAAKKDVAPKTIEHASASGTGKGFDSLKALRQALGR